MAAGTCRHVNGELPQSKNINAPKIEQQHLPTCGAVVANIFQHPGTHTVGQIQMAAEEEEEEKTDSAVASLQVRNGEQLWRSSGHPAYNSKCISRGYSRFEHC